MRCARARRRASIGRLFAPPLRRDADVVADEEALPFRDGSLDLVVSALALQFVNDLPGTLVQIRRALKPDGLFLAALLGGDTLTELRQAFAAAEAEIEGGVSPRVAPFADVREMGALLQRAGFALPVTDVERLTVRYASPFVLMGELRRMGATNVLTERRRTPLRRATLKRMAQIYARALRRSGRQGARDLRDHLALRLGAAREPAEAAAPRLGADAARRRARRARDRRGEKGGRGMKARSSPSRECPDRGTRSASATMRLYAKAESHERTVVRACGAHLSARDLAVERHQDRIGRSGALSLSRYH